MVASPRRVQEFNHRIHVIRPVEVLVPFPTSQTIQQPASATAAGLRWASVVRFKAMWASSRPTAV